MLVTKNAYTDQFFLARRREPMSVSAEIQWSLLPPPDDDHAPAGGRRHP
jgi:hypothetical protein